MAMKRAKNRDRNKSAEDCRRLDFVRRAMVQVRGRCSHHRRPRRRNRYLQHDARDQGAGHRQLSKISVRDGGFVEPGSVLGTIDQV
jgi:hypothetical protein